jgi:hypothetical protein
MRPRREKVNREIREVAKKLSSPISPISLWYLLISPISLWCLLVSLPAERSDRRRRGRQHVSLRRRRRGAGVLPDRYQRVGRKRAVASGLRCLRNRRRVEARHRRRATHVARPRCRRRVGRAGQREQVAALQNLGFTGSERRTWNLGTPELWNSGTPVLTAEGRDRRGWRSQHIGLGRRRGGAEVLPDRH